MTLSDRIQSGRPRMRSLLAVALVPAAAMLVWLLVFEPIHWVVTSQAQWRESARSELARSRGQAKLLETVQKQVDELPSAQVWQRFYPVTSPGSAASAVQRDIAEMSVTAGLENPSIVNLPSEKSGAIEREPVRLTASATADRLQMFLARVREHSRYLRVDRLSVSAPQTQGTDQNPLLLITMDIIGFTREEKK